MIHPVLLQSCSCKAMCRVVARRCKTSSRLVVEDGSLLESLDLLNSCDIEEKAGDF